MTCAGSLARGGGLANTAVMILFIYLPNFTRSPPLCQAQGGGLVTRDEAGAAPDSCPHPLPWKDQAEGSTHSALACCCNSAHAWHTDPGSRCSTQKDLQVSSAQSPVPGGGEHVAPYPSGTGH